MGDSNKGFNSPTLVTRIAPMMADPEPLVVLDRFRIVKPLGHGGMGNVYLAHHDTLDRYAAIKTIRTDYRHRREGLVERFLLEMKAIGQIRHENVVFAHDAGETNGVLHLVMDYLPGHDVGQIASAYGKLKPEDACEIIRQAAWGLDGIHKKAIHRDIKPSNMMLTKDGVVKILDLGLARLHTWNDAAGLTPNGAVLGTHDYMSPEQAGAHAIVDGRADIYSLGCTFFRLLTGHAPYEGEGYSSPTQKIDAHRNVPIRSAREFDTIPAHLQPILLKMTAKAPSDRYVDAKAVALALEPFCVGHDVKALVQDHESDRPEDQQLARFQMEELALLVTAKPTNTPRDREATPFTVDATPTRLFQPEAPSETRGSKRLLVASVAVLVAVCGIAIYFSVAGNSRFFKSPPPIEGKMPAVFLTGAHSVDDLPKNKENYLFGRVPLVTPPLPPGEDSWQSNPETHRLTLNYNDPILLQLGTTRSRDYKIDASMYQVPWTGEAGLFWGYRELPNAAELKAKNQVYATLHYVYLRKPVNAKPATFTMVRGCGGVWIDARGTTCVNRSEWAEHKLPYLSTVPKTIMLEVCDGALQRATFDGIPLDEFRKHEQRIPKNPLGIDGFGVLSFASHATFDNVRFMSTTTTGD